MSKNFYYPSPVKPIYGHFDVAKGPYDYFGVPRECAVVDVTGHEYELCWRTSIWASEKTNSKYGEPVPQEVTLSDGIPFVADQLSAYGFFGEFGWAKVTNDRVDLTYKRGGDEQDFIYQGKSVDVKTLKPGSFLRIPSRPNITAIRGFTVLPIKDLYVCGFTTLHDMKNLHAQIAFVGYITGDILRKKLKENKLVRSAYPNTGNYEVYFGELSPIRDLLE